jgi:hypothetical protein
MRLKDTTRKLRTHQNCALLQRIDRTAVIDRTRS